MYEKQGGGLWLEYHYATNRWLVKLTKDAGQNNPNCVASAACELRMTPEHVPIGTWNVKVKKDTLVLQPGVRALSV